jgi:hypothetical protein
VNRWAKVYQDHAFWLIWDNGKGRHHWPNTDRSLLVETFDVFDAEFFGLDGEILVSTLEGSHAWRTGAHAETGGAHK